MSIPALLAATTKDKPRFQLEKFAFPQQIKFIRDESRLKLGWCTRRSAKSYTFGLNAVEVAEKFPKSNILYVALTRDSAKSIFWKDVIKDIDQRCNLGLVFNETELTATFPNGSIIKLTGADTDEQEMNKLLGKKYRLVGIDEASMFTVDLRRLVYGILKPATADQRGTICLFGTSSNIHQGLFFDVTKGNEPGWSLHTWTAYDNPHVKQQWKEEIDDIERNRPLFMQTALFKQWYLNEWTVDLDAKVYKFDRIHNQSIALPRDISHWNYVLGVDLGHSPDPSAFVVSAFSNESPILFFVHAEKHIKFDVTNVAEKIKELERRWSFQVKVVDNANAQAVAELNNRHQCNLIAADKTGKNDFINLMNAEFIQGHIIALSGSMELQEEWSKLVWQTENGLIKLTPSGQRKEHPGLPNHLTDAALYNWRHCYQYLFKPTEPFKDLSRQDVWEPEHIKRLEEAVRRAQNPTEIDLHFDEDLFDFNKDDNYS